MKKFIIIIISLVILLLAAIIILPIVFKGKIIDLVKTEANKSVNAKINFNNDITLSIFDNFPDFTLGIKDLTIAGVNEFEGDTLLAMKDFTATIDIMSVIKSDKIKIREVILDHPDIHAIVLKNGKANWDIAKPSTDSSKAEPDTAAATFNISLKLFEIKNANIIYDDKSSGMYSAISNLSHKLKGDFSQDNFLLQTITSIDELTFRMGAISYLSKAKTAMKADIDANMKDMKFTFKENEISLNELVLSFDGNFGMKDTNMLMDIKYGIKKSEFKNFLSLIPAVYSKDFKDLKTSGKLGFDGFVKGTYNASQMPAFALNLLVENGMFKYPALPSPVDNVQIKLAVTNPDGNLDHTKIDLSKMHFEISGDPFDAKLVATNPIKDPEVDASLKGRLNLDNITKIVPLENGMKLSGLIISDFAARTKVSDVEAKRYDKVNVSGNIQVQNLTFASKDMPDGINIKNALLSFTPKIVTLKGLDAMLGKTDMKVDGQLENFIPYFLGKGTLVGKVDFRSSLIDANQFLSKETAKPAQPKQPDTASIEAPEIPDNLDITLNANIAKLLYTNMEITDFKGGIRIANKKISFNKLGLNTLGAAISMDGYYESSNHLKPNVNIDFGIQHLEFQKAFVTFNTVKKIAPVAENMKGNFSATFKMTTPLDHQLNPITELLFAEGLLTIPKAQLKGVTVLNKLAEVLKYDRLKDPAMNNVKIQFKVEKGRVYTKPFDLDVAGQKLTLSGSTGLDQTVDYTGKVAIPRAALGAVGSGLNSIMDQLNKKGGTGIKLSDAVNVNLLIGGTFTKPTVSTNLSDVAKNEAKSLKDQAAAELEKKAKELEAKARAEAEKYKKEAEDKARAEAERLKKEAEQKAKSEADKLKKQAEEEAKKKLKGLFGK